MEKKNFCTGLFWLKTYDCYAIEIFLVLERIFSSTFCLRRLFAPHLGAMKPVLVSTDDGSLNHFHSKNFHPPQWNCLDRVLSCNSSLAQITGRPNSAADFLSRMQTDPSLSIQIKLTSHVPIREIAIETEAKAPNVSLSIISELNFLRTCLFLLNLSLASSKLMVFMITSQRKRQLVNRMFLLRVCISVTQVPQVNIIGTSDFEDVLCDLRKRSQPPNLNQAQQTDNVIHGVILWKNRDSLDQSPKLPIDLRKYRKV